MSELGDICPATLHPGDVLLAGGGRGEGQERGGAQVPAAGESSATGPSLPENDGQLTEPTVLLRAAGGGGGHRAGQSVGPARHQAQEEPQRRAEHRAGGAQRCRGEQPQDPGQTGGQGGGAPAGGEEAAGSLSSHYGRGRKVSGEIQGRDRAGQSRRLHEREVQALAQCQVLRPGREDCQHPEELTQVQAGPHREVPRGGPEPGTGHVHQGGAGQQAADGDQASAQGVSQQAEQRQSPGETQTNCISSSHHS